MTALLVLITVVNRLRVQPVVASWHTGRLFGLPLWPVIFIVLVLGSMAYTLEAGHSISPGVFMGYLMGGSFWLIAMMLSSTLLVTEMGIVTNVNRAGQAVAWGQITDYFEIDSGKKTHCVFLYADENGRRRRLELHVPPRHHSRFRHIVRAKVDARMEFGVQQIFGKKALEG